LGVVASGSPADKAGLKAGDIIDGIDGVEVETSSAFEKTTAASSPNTKVRLRVLSDSRERRVAVTLTERPKIHTGLDQAGPLLMLNTGGHIALIKGLAFTPDGEQLVSTGDDTAPWRRSYPRGRVRPAREWP